MANLNGVQAVSTFWSIRIQAPLHIKVQVVDHKYQLVQFTVLDFALHKIHNKYDLSLIDFLLTFASKLWKIDPGVTYKTARLRVQGIEF